MLEIRRSSPHGGTWGVGEKHVNCWLYSFSLTPFDPHRVIYRDV